MRSAVITASVAVLLACLLQGCQSAQSGKANPDVAEVVGADRSAIASQARDNTGLRDHARAYAERLNQSRCEKGREGALFDAASAEAEKSIVNLRKPQENFSNTEDVQLAGETARTLAEVRLEVGDAARIGGCPDIALSQYRAVIGSSPGPGYAQFRKQAEIGLSAMQL